MLGGEKVLVEFMVVVAFFHQILIPMSVGQSHACLGVYMVTGLYGTV